MGRSIKFYVCALAAEMWIVFATQCNGCGTSYGSHKPTTTPYPLSPEERILASIQDAIDQMRDGMVKLPKIDELNNSQPPTNAIRAEKGTTANFTCDMHQINRLAPVGGSLVWHHQNRIIDTKVIAPATNKAFFYSHGGTQQTSYLFIHNITADAAGSVECFVQNGTNAVILVKQYNLIPKLQAKDVFAGEMKNISTKYWKLALTCKTFISCHSGADPYFAWRYDGRFVKAPADHYINEVRGFYPHTIWDLQFSSAVSEEQGTCDMTMSAELLSTLTLVPTTAECWVRTHPSSDEWYIQTSYIQFE